MRALTGMDSFGARLDQWTTHSEKVLAELGRGDSAGVYERRLRPVRGPAGTAAGGEAAGGGVDFVGEEFERGSRLRVGGSGVRERP